MQIQQQPVDTWSDQEVNQILTMVDSIDAKLNTIEQNTINSEVALVNTTVAVVAITTATYALVFLASIKIGYMISHYFLPSPKDIGG